MLTRSRPFKWEFKFSIRQKPSDFREQLSEKIEEREYYKAELTRQRELNKTLIDKNHTLTASYEYQAAVAQRVLNIAQSTARATRNTRSDYKSRTIVDNQDHRVLCDLESIAVIFDDIYGALCNASA